MLMQLKYFKNYKYKIILLVLVLILYGDSIFFGYISDDFTAIKFNLYNSIYESIYGIYFRPVWYLSYVVTNFFFHSSFFDHLVNIILFIYCSILLFNYTQKYYSINKSFLAVSIWISLPWMVFPTVWISQRNDLLLIIFAILSLNYYNVNKNLSKLYLVLSFLSKTNSFILPTYFLILALKEKKKKDTIFYVILQIVFLLISYRSLIKSTSPPYTPYIDLNFIESILNKITHLIISLTTQILPIPFFINIYHFIFYSIVLIILIKNLKKNKITKRFILSDNFILFLIFWLPSIATSELRIMTLCSYFLILLLFSIYDIKSMKLFYIFLFLFFTNNIFSIYFCKNKFRTNEYNYKNKTELKDNFTYYNNNFYSEKRKLFTKLLKYIKHEYNVKSLK